MLKSVYVAATSQHVGKTTSTLGLVAALSNQGHDVGYCKPVGQQFLDLGQLKVDKDALLFSKVMDFELSSELHSPVILGRGATTAFLDNPDTFHFADRIRYAASHLQKENEIFSQVPNVYNKKGGCSLFYYDSTNLKSIYKRVEKSDLSLTVTTHTPPKMKRKRKRKI